MGQQSYVRRKETGNNSSPSAVNNPMVSASMPENQTVAIKAQLHGLL